MSACRWFACMAVVVGCLLGPSAGAWAQDAAGDNPLGDPRMVAISRVPSFQRTFADQRLTLNIQGGPERFQGEILFGEQRFPLQGQVRDGKLTGHFESGGHQFAFEGALEGEQLTFVTGGTTYHLKRQRSANPLAGTGQPAVSPTPAPAPQPSGAANLQALADLGPVRQDPQRDWTLLVYIAADNDLERFGLLDINEMEQALPQRGVDVVVLIDRAAGYDDSEGDWTDARVLHVQRDADPARLGSSVLAQVGEINTGDPATLQAFLAAGIKTFPARHYGLILWDHGGGWAAMATDHDAPGAPGAPGTSGAPDGFDKLELPEMRQAIAQGLKDAGVKKLDLVGFDMCLMAQLETAAELQGLADCMVASQAIEPGDGWPYDAILPHFGKGTLGTRRLAGEIVTAYGAFYEGRQERISTLSAFDLTMVDQVLAAFDALVAKLDPLAPQVWPDISRALFYAEAYADRTDFQRGEHALASVDLLDVAKRLRHGIKDFPAHDEYQRLVQVMDRFVLATHKSERHRLSNGVALYGPINGKAMASAYTQTRLGANSRWAKLLGKVHQAQAAQIAPARFSDFRLTDSSSKPVQAIDPLSGGRMRFTLDGKNVVWTQSWHGQMDPQLGGMKVFAKGYVLDEMYFTRKKEAVADAVDLIMPAYVDGPNELEESLYGVRWLVSDGENAVGATIDGSDLSDPNHLVVPALYEHPSMGRTMALLFFNRHWWQAAGVMLQLEAPDGTVLMRQVQPEPDATITPLYQVIAEDGSVSLAPSGQLTWGQGLELLMDLAEPGDYRAAYTAVTMAGTQTTQFVDYAVNQSDWLSGGRAGEFTWRDLIGTWDLYTTDKQWNEIPLNRVYEIQPHPQLEGLLVAKITSTKDPSQQSLVLMAAETRGLPNVRFFTLDKDGNWDGGFEYGPCSYGRLKGGRQALLMTLMGSGGMLMHLAKREEAGGPGGQPHQAMGGGAAGAHDQAQQGGQVDGQAQPAQAVSLVGVWRDAEGEFLACDERQWALHDAFGQAYDGGTYEIRGDRLIATDVEGDAEVFRFKVEGNRLTLIDEDGDPWVLVKVK